MVNYRIFYVVTIIKNEVVKEKENARDNFIVIFESLLREEEEEEPKAVIAGSGVGPTSAEILGDYIVATLKEKIN